MVLPGRRGRWDTVTVSVNFLFLIPAPKASWTPEAPRHFEESQWGPEKRASEERVCVCVWWQQDGMKCVCFESMGHFCTPWSKIYTVSFSAATVVPFDSQCLWVCSCSVYTSVYTSEVRCVCVCVGADFLSHPLLLMAYESIKSVQYKTLSDWFKNSPEECLPCFARADI